MDLSILIPARNEEFLSRTVDDILSHIEGDTEIIVVDDGGLAGPSIVDHPRVRVLHYPTSIGQRAATNVAARASNAKFVMKCDAHCAFDQGFDVKLMADCEKDWTVIPRMYNLHVFDWVCEGCGNRVYQGPMPVECKKCGGKSHKREMMWEIRWHKKTDFARFDNNLHFQYWGAYGSRAEAQGDIADVMCSVGACWFMHRERFWEIDGMDEGHGSWGQMGVEVACKSWLSGGRQVVNKKTWYAHLFRTQPGFGFPYPNPGSQVEQARKYSRNLWVEGLWPKSKYPLSWLIKKFAPVPDWPDYDQPESPAVVVKKGITKGLVYYTDNRCEKRIVQAAQRVLKKNNNGYRLVSVSLEPIAFGENIVLDRERGILTMFKQILTGLEALDTDVVFLVEHDVLYHMSHFLFIPPTSDAYYYNENTWKVDVETGRALFYYTKQTSGLCAYRDLLVGHYRRRVAKLEQNIRDLTAAGQVVKNDGYSRYMGFEPGCHRVPRGVDDYKAERWMSDFPNVDLRHSTNLTPSRWNRDQFRDKNSCLGWTMADEVPGWGRTKDRMDDFLNEL